MTEFTSYHSQYLAHRITLEGVDDEALAKALTSARVDMNPHQVDAALFALQSPLTKGVILADEVGLGKTIEAALVIAQKWAERKRRILLIVPASLRKQWAQELWEKFTLPTLIMEARSYNERVRAGERQPFDTRAAVIVISYEFAGRRIKDLERIPWDLLVFDEAHRLRNVYRQGGSARSKSLKDGLRDPFKLLLTATPLQNTILELYGLVSVIDDKLFGDEASFRLQYTGHRADTDQLDMLRQRLAPICRRTLRKTVQEAGHISYTLRIPVTFHFEPYAQEVELYELVSEFLQRPDTHYLGGKPNALITMSLRKILGSSNVAIADTLTRIIDRLKARRRVEQEDLDDLDTIDEMAEEIAGLEDGQNATPPSADVRPKGPSLAAEIRELTGYRDLARSIAANAKAEQLIGQLPGLLDTIEGKGGRRKVVIFTESTRTQTYLAALLTERGFAGEIVLLNGSNSDRESGRLYAEWLARHAGGDRVSGSRSADMKAAIVDAFRGDKTILIATESGAEGINLQFCSLLVNFDLPWNPQRVEQRIGRCHRYGQRIDVIVVNLLNLKNRAEERVFELLAHKFQLFEGVFGASDEVLGAIESGLDFERRVHQIVQTARRAEEVEAAFNELTESLQEQIALDLRHTRDRLLQNMDEEVVHRLRIRQDTLKKVLSTFEQRLVTLARAELPGLELQDHVDGSPFFTYEGKTWTTDWALADEMGWEFFRLADGNLAQNLVTAAKGRSLPTATLVLDYTGRVEGGASRFADLEPFVGSAGWLRITKLRLKSAGRIIEHLLSSAIADDGQELDQESVERLFLLAGTPQTATQLPPMQLAALETRLKDRHIESGTHANADWLATETDKLDRYANDLEVTAEEKIVQLQNEVTKRNRARRAAVGWTMQQTMDEQREIKKLEAVIDDKKLETHQRRQAARAEVGRLLDRLQTDLAIEPTVEPLFCVRWELV